MATTSTTSLNDATKRELYELATERNVSGRSKMSAAQLRRALADGQAQSKKGAAKKARAKKAASKKKPGTKRAAAKKAASKKRRSAKKQTARKQAAKKSSSKTFGAVGEAGPSRRDAFERLARARAGDQSPFPPKHLTGHDRRLHVRQTIREDHHTRIASGAEDAQAKFDKLARSPFDFFRGTSLLFYRDMAGEDAWMPTVLTLGDVHPDNFGVMPSADNVPIFGVNDFDEAYYAPFTWDLKRGATGFLIAAGEEGGQGRKRRRAVVKRFVRSYLDGIATFAREGHEAEHQIRLDNAPKLIRELIEDAQEDRSDWLADDYHDETGTGFRANEKLVPVTGRRREFQAVIDRLVDGVVTPPARAGDMRVKDVAERKGQGTASLGLPRYYVMIEGPQADGSDDLIIELKQGRRSSLAGLVPPSDMGFRGEGGRIRHAHGVHLVHGDVFYGHVDFEGLTFLSRERAPYRDSIDLDDLSDKQWKSYAAVCGETLAHAHALSDDTGELDHDVEPEILAAVRPADLFVDDILSFAEEAAARVRADHRHFRADHALGAFSDVDAVYR